MAFASCENYILDDTSDSHENLELTFSPDGIESAEGLSKAVTSGIDPTIPNAINVPVEADIAVTFDVDIDQSTLNTNTFKVTRVDTKEVLAGSIAYLNRVATFIPTRVYVVDTVKKNTFRKGLKQDTSYIVTIAAANIKSTSGTPQGTGDYTFTFKTVNLDYGFFFLGANGEYQKAVPGRNNLYYDESKPTVIFYHGWNKNSTSNDFSSETGFFFNSSAIGSYNEINSWQSRGYNVCISYWSQWADEGEVKDAQAKLWLGNNGKRGMRYMVRGGSYIDFPTTYSVTDLLYFDYIEIFKNTVSGIRFMGHSCGTQLATLLAYKISKAVEAGSVSSNLMPTRVALLDPFWGKGSETYSGGMSPGAKSVIYMKEMLVRDAFALEEIRTNSNIGYWVGDSNIEMRKISAYYCPWPSFGDDAAKHIYAYNWYAMSMNKIVYADKAPGLYGLGAAASDDQIKAVMNWDFTKKTIKATLYKYQINAGKTTVTPADDKFLQSTGI